MYLKARKFRIAKANTPIQACEDACAWDLSQGRFVVCDGATTSSYSAEWANLLANLFIASPPQNIAQADLHAWLARIQEQWSQEIPWDKLDYFSQRKAQMGAYATLAGMCLEPPAEFNGRLGWEREEIKVRISVVEDSCSLLLRNDKIERSWPYITSSQFQGPPYAVASLPENNRRLAQYWKTEEIKAQPGDLFILATDAISQFLMRRFEQDPQGWQEARTWLHDLLSIPETKDAESRFADFVEQMRSGRDLRNDDVAIILVWFAMEQ